jgi:hypothetical protein
MKASLIFYSKTSEKIADAVSKELKLLAESVKMKPKLHGVDMLFIVSGIYAGKNAPGLISYVKKLNKSIIKKAVLITCCVGKSAKQTEIREILQRKGIEVLPEEYICRGSFLLAGLGHPDKKEIEDAVSFAKKVWENK